MVDPKSSQPPNGRDSKSHNVHALRGTHSVIQDLAKHEDGLAEAMIYIPKQRNVRYVSIVLCISVLGRRNTAKSRQRGQSLWEGVHPNVVSVMT